VIVASLSLVTTVPTIFICLQGLGPVLMLCSEDDDLAPCHVVCGFARRLIELGTDVKVIKWSDSPHVGMFLCSYPAILCGISDYKDCKIPHSV
jgi:acetyl esterase/lipase